MLTESFTAKCNIMGTSKYEPYETAYNVNAIRKKLTILLQCFMQAITSRNSLNNLFGLKKYQPVESCTCITAFESVPPKDPEILLEVFRVPISTYPRGILFF